MTELIYMASPYSHPDPAVMLKRYELACQAAASLMAHGYLVYSPIAHSVPISKYLTKYGIAINCLDFWIKQDLPILEQADAFTILMIDGWRESKGIAIEHAFALDNDIPVMDGVFIAADGEAYFGEIEPPRQDGAIRQANTFDPQAIWGEK